MKLLRQLVLVAWALAAYALPADAHHAFAAVYDDKQMVTVVGVVTQFQFVNPHARLQLDVTDPGGKVAKWTVEFAGRLNLEEVGWTADSIKRGEKVTVTGNPTHTASTRIAFVRLVRADGQVLLPAGAQRVDALEQERRQRALRRSNQQQ